MIKRTLWYACLLLLCCSAGVLVVMATSAGKTTLITDSKTSITANPVMDVYLGAVNPESTPVAVPKEAEPGAAAETAVARTTATAGENDVKEAIPTAQAEPEILKENGPEIKTAEELRDFARHDDEMLRKNEALLRKDRELAAIARGMNPNTAAEKTDAELLAFANAVVENRTARTTLDGVSEVKRPDMPVVDYDQKVQEERDAAAEAQAAAQTQAQTVAEETAPEYEVQPAPVFESFPDFVTTGESGGQVFAEETVIPFEEPGISLEKQVGELIAKDQAGEKLTSADKEVLATYARTLPTGNPPRNRDNLDDNGGTTYVYSGATLPVPPGTGSGGGTDTTFAPITVSGSGGPILDVEIEIDSLTHEYMNDVDIYLRSPSGTRCELSTDNGGYSESYYARVRFDDDATTNINTVTTAPIIGTYKPEGLLSVFDNESADGNWNLIVYDDAGGDIGYLYSWRIQILTMNGLYANDYWTYNISSPAAGTTYAPSSSVTVTAAFMNYGSTQQPCSVKYQFNGGSVEAEVTASLVQYATENHSFATQITMPATPGDYELVVWSDLATDQDRTNDTLRRTVHVDYDGYTCATAISFTSAGPDSFLYNNCAAGDSTPGQTCGASGEDMVFYMNVADGEQAEFWQTSNAIDSRHSLRWGGACPGTTVIDCKDDPDEVKMRYVNHTGSTQTIYFTVGGYTNTTTCGNLRVAWQRQTTSSYTTPYTSSFEIVLAPPVTQHYTTLPNFWSVENSNGDAYTWSNYSGGAANGTYCAYAYSGNAAGNNDWLFTPGLQLSDGQTYYLDYFRKSYSTSYPESLEVKIGTENASSAMTQTLVALDSFRVNSWVERGTAFTVSSAGTYYIGFHSMTMRSSAGCYLDSVRVLLDECSAPTVTANAATGTNSATLTTTVSGGHGGPVQYQWFTGEGCVNGNQIPYATGASYIALSSGIFSVRAWRADSVNCASCDSAEATVTSPCVAQTIPYVDNFDDVTATALPACWLQESADGASPVWATNTTSPLTSPNAAYILGSTAGNNDWLFSEPLSLTGGTTYVFQYWRRAYSATYADCVQVKYGTLPLSVAMLNTIHGPDTCKTSTTYLKKAALFTPATSGTYYIGINSLTKSSSAGTRIDSVHVYEYGPCGAPSVTVNAGSGQYSVTLTANVSGGFGGPYIYQWYTGETCTAGNEIAGANGPKYTAWAAGIYACRVYCGPDSVNCSTCDSANVVLTCGTPTALPNYQNFDGVTTPALPTCWTYEDGNNNAVYWRTSTTYRRTTPNSVYIYGSTTQNDWLYTTGYSLTGGTTYWIDFFRYNSSTTYADCLEVKYGILPGSAYMTTQIAAPDTSKTNQWKYKGASFTPASSGTYFIGIHSLSTSSSAYTYIDDINVYEDGTCAAPSVTVNAGTGQYSVTLTANVTGGYGGPYYYQWYTGENCFTGNEIVGATSSTYIAWEAGIYSCKAGCGPAGVCTACDSAMVTLTCTTPSSPMYFEGFESTTGTALPTCWTYQDLFYTSNYWRTTTTTPYQGLRDAYMYGYSGTYVADDWMYTSGISLNGGTTYWLDYYRRNSSASYSDSLEVMYGTQPFNTAMTNVLAAADTNKTTTWKKYTASFTPSTTGTYFIGFHCMSRHYSSSAYTYLDNIRVYEDGTCAAPDSVRVNGGIGGDSLVLTANIYGGYGGAPSYQWYTGEGCQAGNEIAGATNKTYAAVSSGVYSVKARYQDSDACSGCDSANVTIVSCSNVYAPLDESFESATVPNLPVCWTRESFNAPSDDWLTSTSYPRSGTKSAYISWDGSLPLDDWMYSIGLNLSADTLYRVKYYYRAGSSSYTERLGLFYGRAATRDSMLYTLVPSFGFSNTVYDSQEVPFQPPVTGRYFLGFYASSIANQLSIYVDDVKLWVVGSCTPPSSVTVNAVEGSDSAKLKALAVGGTGGGYQYQWYTGIDCQTGNEIVGANADSVWVFTSGSYSCKVWIVDAVACALCDSGYATVINCGAGFTPPYSQNFDMVTTPTLPVCWTQEDVGAVTPSWATSTSYRRSLPNSAFISYNYSSPLNDWLYTPALNLDADSLYTIEWWYRARYSYYTEIVGLYAGTTANSASMTTTIVSPFSFNQEAYVARYDTFRAPSTGQYYFGWHASSIANQDGISIDDIKIRKYGTCGAPDSVRVNAAVGTLYVKLTANVYGGFGCPIQYQWYTGESCQTGNEITGANAADYYALSTGTYSVKAWYCSPDTCAACDSAAATVNPDPCSSVTPPVIQKFDGVTAPALPTCWTQENSNGDANYWRTYTSNYRSAPNCVYINYNSSLAMNDWFFSPRLNLTADTTYIIEYWYRSYGSTTLPDCMEVKVGNLPVSFAQTTTLRTPWQLTSATYQRDTIHFTPSTSGDFYVGWHGISRPNAWYIYLDDVAIYKVGQCLAPDSVRVNDTAGTLYAKLTANVYGGLGEPTYQWFIGGTCQAGNDISGATSLEYYALNSGVYSFLASTGSGCAVCDSAVATISPDPCTPYPINPFIEDFESTTGTDLPTCWSYQDLNYTAAYWRTTTTTPHSGLRDVYMYGYQGTYVADDWMYTAPVVLQGGVEYALDYWRRNSSATYADSLEVMYGTIPLNVFMTNVAAPADTNKTTTWVNKLANFTPSVTDTYYLGFHCMSRHYSSSAYTYLDDIMLYRSDTCAAPTVVVEDSARIGMVTMKATATGGIGSPLVYQWYSGGTCDEANRIDGANSATYQTLTSGTFSCRVYRRDSTACAACDSGVATILPIPQGWDCANPITLTPPPFGSSTQVTGTTVGFENVYIDTCDYTGTAISVIYELTLTSCRRLTFSLDTFETTTGGDKHMAVYESGMCGVRSFMCNDDKAYFPTLVWEGVNQRPTYGTGSFCGGEMPAGTYYIQVGCYSGTTTGPYKLTVYDNGACPCDITCSGGDVAEITENRYNPSHLVSDPDGGCNSSPVSFDLATCGTTICGRAWTYQRSGSSYQQNRDTDWYVFSITSRNIVTVTLDAEFPAWVLVVDTNGCVGATTLLGDTNVVACVPTTISDTLDPGTYTLAVLPKYYHGNPLPSQYRLTLNCACLVWPVDSVTAILVNADGDPATDDIRIRWIGTQEMVDNGGTYTIYYNTDEKPFPGNGWTQLVTGLTPVAPPAANTYDDLDVTGATARRFYLVVGSCQ